ncbi:MAG: M48 family metalloprotease [Fusobacteriota bacterium]
MNKTNLKKFKGGIGKYSYDELLEITNECFLEINNKEIPTIYIIPDKIGSPAVIDSMFFNIIKPFNAIYIPEYIFYILKKEEIQAIIGHEIGHFYHYINPISRSIFIFYLFLVLFFIYAINIHISVMISFILPTIFIFHNFIFRFESKNYEYLADYFSAKKYGTLNLINSIISIKKYIEIVESINESILNKIKNNKMLITEDYNKIFEDVYNKSMEKLKSKTNIEIKADEILDEKQITKYERKISKIKLYFDNKKIKKNLNENQYKFDNNIVDWNKFDLNKNYRIDKDEYKKIIDLIITNKDVRFFNDLSELEKYNKSHPILAKRLLFLYKNLNI